MRLSCQKCNFPFWQSKYSSSGSICILVVTLLSACGGSGGGGDETFLAATDISLGYQHGCVILENAKVKCWGSSYAGQLGLGSTQSRGANPGEMGDNLPYVNLGTGRTAESIDLGSTHSCALLDNGSVKCWGENGSGQLGLGDTRDRGLNPGEMGDNLPTVNLGTGRTALQIVAGSLSNCALLDDESVKCWGNSSALGLGDGNDRGDQPGEMGDSLPTVDLGTGRTAIQLAAGSFHVCALLDDLSVKCWGQNSDGALGLETENSVGSSPNEMGDFLPAVNLGTNKIATQIIAGANNTCALVADPTLTDGGYKCWGDNFFGQLGLGDVDDRGDEVNEMGDFLPDLTLGAGVVIDQISISSSSAAGVGHICAKLDDGRIKCWGANDVGQLGLGDQENRGDEISETGDAIPFVSLGSGRTAIKVEAGSKGTCALLGNGRVKCWGGTGGLEDFETRGDQPGEMGNNLPSLNFGTK